MLGIVQASGEVNASRPARGLQSRSVVNRVKIPSLIDELRHYRCDEPTRGMSAMRRRVRAHAKAIIEGRSPWPKELIRWKAIEEFSCFHGEGRYPEPPWLDIRNLTRPQREREARLDAEALAEAKRDQLRSKRIGARYAMREAAIKEREELRARRHALGKAARYLHGVPQEPLTDPLGPREDESLPDFWRRVDREHPPLTHNELRIPALLGDLK